MAVEDDSIVLIDNVNQGLEVSLVGCCRHEWVVELQEFPVGLGLGKGLGEEINLNLLIFVAGLGVVVVVDRSGLSPRKIMSIDAEQ